MAKEPKENENEEAKQLDSDVHEKLEDVIEWAAYKNGEKKEDVAIEVYENYKKMMNQIDELMGPLKASKMDPALVNSLIDDAKNNARKDFYVTVMNNDISEIERISTENAYSGVKEALMSVDRSDFAPEEQKSVAEIVHGIESQYNFGKENDVVKTTLEKIDLGKLKDYKFNPSENEFFNRYNSNRKLVSNLEEVTKKLGQKVKAGDKTHLTEHELAKTLKENFEAGEICDIRKVSFSVAQLLYLANNENSAEAKEILVEVAKEMGIPELATKDENGNIVVKSFEDGKQCLEGYIKKSEGFFKSEEAKNDFNNVIKNLTVDNARKQCETTKGRANKKKLSTQAVQFQRDFHDIYEEMQELKKAGKATDEIEKKYFKLLTANPEVAVEALKSFKLKYEKESQINFADFITQSISISQSHRVELVYDQKDDIDFSDLKVSKETQNLFMDIIKSGDATPELLDKMASVNVDVSKEILSQMLEMKIKGSNEISTDAIRHFQERIEIESGKAKFKNDFEKTYKEYKSAKKPEEKENVLKEQHDLLAKDPDFALEMLKSYKTDASKKDFNAYLKNCISTCQIIKLENLNSQKDSINLKDPEIAEQTKQLFIDIIESGDATQEDFDMMVSIDFDLSKKVLKQTVEKEQTYSKSIDGLGRAIKEKAQKKSKLYDSDKLPEGIKEDGDAR